LMKERFEMIWKEAVTT